MFHEDLYMKLLRLLVVGQLILILVVCLTLIEEVLSRRDAIALDVPSFKGSDSGEVVALNEDGGRRWSQRWSQTIRETESGTMVLFRESGEGVQAPFEESVRWEVNSSWEMDPRFRPLKMEREFYSLAGELLRRESMVLDWDRSIAEFVRIHPEENSPERETFEVPPDTLIVSGIASALRGFPFGSDRTIKAHLLSNEPNLYGIEIESKGQEEIAVPAGNFEAYRLKLNIDLGFLNLFRAFLPDTYFWFHASHPYSWLRYRGLEGGRGTPEIEMRLLEMESHRNSASTIFEQLTPALGGSADIRSEQPDNYLAGSGEDVRE